MTPRLDRIALAATTSAADVDALINESIADARAGRPVGIVVPPAFAKYAIDRVRASSLSIRVASVVAYPLGLAKPTIKAIEATNLAKEGIDAVEVSPLLANLARPDADGGYDAFRRELLEIVRGGRAARPTLSVHVRIDLDAFAPTAAAWPAIVNAIRQGACDGVVLASTNDGRLRDALAALPRDAGFGRKIVVDRDPSEAADVDAIGRPSTPR